MNEAFLGRGEPFWKTHRGPFRFLVVRKGKKGPKSEWLKGTISRDDVAEEAWSLLTDPRDAITSISVWSDTENQFVGGFPARPNDWVKEEIKAA